MLMKILVQVWAFPTTDMQCEWLGERVATVDINRAINNVVLNKEDAGWGPNAVFRFPLEGGTGAIWKKVAKLLPEQNQVPSQAPILSETHILNASHPCVGFPVIPECAAEATCWYSDLVLFPVGRKSLDESFLLL